MKSIKTKLLSIWGPICGDSSLKSRFLRVGNLLSVNFKRFAKIMISATDSYQVRYIPGIEQTHNLVTIILGPAKIEGPWTRSIF